jgi:pimeloyl-ACP methyl ester carboxylesterase
MVMPYRSHVAFADEALARRRLTGLQDVSFRTSDGLLLRGWFAPGARGDAVIFVHGLGANRMAFLPEAILLSQQGHGVLVYDSRASGESEGRVATWGDRERLDLRAAIELVMSKPGLTPGKIGLFGCSVGGTTVALESAADRRVGAVLLGPTWPSFREEMQQNNPGPAGLEAFSVLLSVRLAGLHPELLQPIDVVHQIAPRPLFLLSGSEDADTPPAEMARLQAAAPGSERWVVPGAGHCSYLTASPIEYPSRLLAFFDRAFPRP